MSLKNCDKLINVLERRVSCLLSCNLKCNLSDTNCYVYVEFTVKKITKMLNLVLFFFNKHHNDLQLATFYPVARHFFSYRVSRHQQTLIKYKLDC